MSRRVKIIISGVSAFILAGTVTGAVATIPDSDDGEIHACRSNGRGVLHVIDAESGESCSTGETELVWNQTGPEGPEGPQGEQGPAGPLHPVYVKSESITVENTGLPVPQLSCNTGDRLLSASNFTPGSNAGLSGSEKQEMAINEYILDANSEPVGVKWRFHNSSTRTYSVVCMNLP